MEKTLVVLTRETQDTVQLSSLEEMELLEAIAEADRGETISAEVLFARRDRRRQAMSPALRAASRAAGEIGRAERWWLENRPAAPDAF